MTDTKAVLFVCLGNICRSPLAEGAMRKAAREASLTIDIDSCGTGDYHVGKSPDPRSVETAAANGIDISDLRARQIDPDDFTRFTHIYAMDHENLRVIDWVRPPRTPARVSLLMDVVSGREGSAIADPYYQSADRFEETWSDVWAAAQALAARIKSGA